MYDPSRNPATLTSAQHHDNFPKDPTTTKAYTKQQITEACNKDDATIFGNVEAVNTTPIIIYIPGEQIINAVQFCFTPQETTELEAKANARIERAMNRDDVKAAFKRKADNIAIPITPPPSSARSPEPSPAPSESDHSDADEGEEEGDAEEVEEEEED